MMELVAGCSIAAASAVVAAVAGAECCSSIENSKRASWEPETGSILDPFHIEDLLDFSNEDIAGPIGEEQQQLLLLSKNNNKNHDSSSSSGITTDNNNINNTNSSNANTNIAKQQSCSGIDQHNQQLQQQNPSSNEFPIDCDEMPELEWLSSLVEDDTFSMDEMHKNMFIGSKGGSCYSSPPLSNNLTKNNSINNNNNISSVTIAMTNKEEEEDLLEEDNVMINSSNNNNNNNINKRSYSNLFIDEAMSSGKDGFQVGSPISVLESSSATSGRLVTVVKDLAVPGRPRSKRMRSSAANTAWNNTSSCLVNPPPTSSNLLLIASSSPATSSISDKDFVSSEDNSSLYEQDVVDSGVLGDETGLQQQQLKNNNNSSSNDNSSNSLLFSSFNSSSPVSKAAGKPPLQAPPRGAAAGAANDLQPRRCTHCLSQKTPQWRAGPEGPKTLCNACGVRFKSGRLFPEYRPALSPTFLSDVHSNSHRKVLEMRRQKEGGGGLHRGIGSSSSSSSLVIMNSASSSAASEEIDDGGLIYK